MLAAVLSSPKFLYLGQSSDGAVDYVIASRLATFLWASVPDDELLGLAAAGKLSDPGVLAAQTDRMLNDPRARRLPQQFVRQWLGLDPLASAEVDADLRAAMAREPVAFFEELLRTNGPVTDVLHSDWTMANGVLARHYGIPGVTGDGFRRVALPPDLRRGGLLTQAGVLTMNADGTDSHPLKRGIWLLERVLNDPPPPPPPAVPEIDLTDPNILKLTLKERMEDHRRQPACASCHQRIDPWGIAFENFDGLGRCGRRSTENRSTLPASCSTARN